MLIDKNWHAKKIQRRLGHASYMTTMQTYGHLADLGGADELDGMEDWFGAPAAKACEVVSVRRTVRHASVRRLARR